MSEIKKGRLLCMVVCEDNDVRDAIKEAVGTRYDDRLELFYMDNPENVSKYGWWRANVTIGVHTAAKRKSFKQEDFDLRMRYSGMKNIEESIIPETLRVLDGYYRSHALFEKIKKGIVKIAFHQYLFGACHEYDRVEFSLIKDGEKIGLLTLLDEGDEYEFFDGEKFLFCQRSYEGRKNGMIMMLVKRLIREAIIRDDQEYQAWFGYGDPTVSVELPCCYSDLTRKELFALDRGKDFAADAFFML